MTSGNLALGKPEPLLRVSSLSVEYDAAGGDVVRALRGVELEIAAGETVGVLGESGSGKSSLAAALLRLLPPNARIAAGHIEYRGRNLEELSSRELRQMRGAEVALISQEPALALNPVVPLGRQLADVLRAHGAPGASARPGTYSKPSTYAKKDRAGIQSRCHQVLREVGFDDPERILRAYPHQLSGGQRQRVAIAQALVCRPRVLIADEPLSSLDAATQAEIVELLQRLQRELGLAVVFITHNAGVLGALAGRIIVMRQGEVLARGRLDDLQANPDPYIQGVLFPERSVLSARKPPAASPAASTSNPNAGRPLLEVRRLSKAFVQRHMLSRSRFEVQALQDIDLELQPGTTVAVLGRSGSGKSTLARCIAGFDDPDAGEILLQGQKRPSGKNSHKNVAQALFCPFMRNSGARMGALPVPASNNARSLPGWLQVQMIFQDAATSVNPRFTARQVIAEPLVIARWKSDPDRAARALELMEEVGLDPASAGRLAGEFSGGQRQRLAFARALAAGPRLLIMDEALSGLDMPLQAQIVRLMMELQSRYGLTYLYISHDLNFVSLFAQEIVVMEAGRIVERLEPARLSQSSHPATRALLEASERLHAPGVEAAV